MAADVFPLSQIDAAVIQSTIVQHACNELCMLHLVTPAASCATFTLELPSARTKGALADGKCSEVTIG